MSPKPNCSNPVNTSPKFRFELEIMLVLYWFNLGMNEKKRVNWFLEREKERRRKGDKMGGLGHEGMGRTLRRETRTKSGSSNIDVENGKWRNTFRFTDVPNPNCF
ncbi:hypothetical protein MTR_8g020915 [Medicago truncatula]|uniref:Uncharacterized protein n=1 Tax=Medicago truncatula TaxID=3880 RepID=A0A072TLU9_MEDTR|nr:hypothetical protein MTR_8g020915 [Medicago truncatula]